MKSCRFCGNSRWLKLGRKLVRSGFSSTETFIIREFKCRSCGKLQSEQTFARPSGPRNIRGQDGQTTA